MEHVAFLIEESGVLVRCLLNPETLVVRRLAGVRTRQPTGGRQAGGGALDDLVFFTGGGRTDLEMDLLFDIDLPGSSPPAQNVRDLTGPIWQLAENSARSQGMARPPLVRFLWGKAWNIPGVVLAIAERFESFTPAGVARRSWLRMRFLRVSDAPRPEPGAQAAAPARQPPQTAAESSPGAPGEPSQVYQPLNLGEPAAQPPAGLPGLVDPNELLSQALRDSPAAQALQETGRAVDALAAAVTQASLQSAAPGTPEAAAAGALNNAVQEMQSAMQSMAPGATAPAPPAEPAPAPPEPAPTKPPEEPPAEPPGEPPSQPEQAPAEPAEPTPTPPEPAPAQPEEPPTQPPEEPPAKPPEESPSQPPEEPPAQPPVETPAPIAAAVRLAAAQAAAGEALAGLPAEHPALALAKQALDNLTPALQNLGQGLAQAAESAQQSAAGLAAGCAAQVSGLAEQVAGQVRGLPAAFPEIAAFAGQISAQGMLSGVEDLLKQLDEAGPWLAAAWTQQNARLASQAMQVLALAGHNLRAAGAVIQAVSPGALLAKNLSDLQASLQLFEAGRAGALAAFVDALRRLEAAARVVLEPAERGLPPPGDQPQSAAVLEVAAQARQALRLLDDPQTRPAGLEAAQTALGQLETLVKDRQVTEAAQAAGQVRAAAQRTGPEATDWQAGAEAADWQAPTERLDQIAFRYYGSSAYWRLLARANQIDNPLSLAPDQPLVIPPDPRVEAK